MLPQVSLNGLLFNTTNTYQIDGAPGLFLPPIRRASFDLPGANFGVFVQSLYGRRRFSLTGLVVGSDWTDFGLKRDALAAALDITGGEHVITFTLVNGTTRTITAGLVQQTFDPDPQYVAAAKFSLDFEAAFPYLTGTSQTQTLTLATQGGGIVPATVPMSLSANVGGSLILTNNGTAASYPTAIINGPIVNPALRNLTTGIDLQLSITLTSGQALALDFTKHTVVDQTGTNQYAALSGGWWTLSKGANQIALVADAYNASASALIAYADTYLSL